MALEEIKVYRHRCSDPNSMVFDIKEEVTLLGEILSESETGCDFETSGGLLLRISGKRPFIRQMKVNMSWFKSNHIYTFK